MRRLLRILLNVATVLSLVLCMATAGLWMRSYTVAYEAQWCHSGEQSSKYTIASADGKLGFFEMTKNWRTVLGQSYFVSFPVDPGGFQNPRLHWTGAGTWHGFAWRVACHRDDSGNYVTSYSALTIPHWFIVLTTAAIPATQLYRVVRRFHGKRSNGMRCRHCGYDCRATPNRCPECGTVPITKAARPGGAATPG
jgi:hypothetical protein